MQLAFFPSEVSVVFFFRVIFFPSAPDLFHFNVDSRLFEDPIAICRLPYRLDPILEGATCGQLSAARLGSSSCRNGRPSATAPQGLQHLHGGLDTRAKQPLLGCQPDPYHLAMMRSTDIITSRPIRLPSWLRKAAESRSQ